MTPSQSRYRATAAQMQGGQLHITWADGHTSRFHGIWLRHQCTCKDCGTPVDGVRGVRLRHLPDTPAVRTLYSRQDAIEVHWADDDHLSRYDLRWLRDHCYSPEERAARKFHPTLWDATIFPTAPTGSLSEAETSPAARLKILEAVRDYGFCKMIDVPTDKAEAQRLIRLVGPQRQTNFGTYTLKKKQTVANVGDTTTALEPHVDETYRLSAIGITVFQVQRPSSNGGDSTLVDGFEAVRRLRDRWPEDFALLCRVPIVGQRYDAGHSGDGLARWYKSRLPVIKCDHEGEVAGVRLNERQISPLDIDHELVEPTYRALKRLYAILYDPDLLITFALKAGEGLLFDNQRLLHGRTAFTPEEPPRAVLTSSVDLDEFHSSLRLLQNQLQPDRCPQLPLQGMAV